MTSTEAKLGDRNKVNSIATQNINYTVDYSLNYEKHNSHAEACAKEVIQLATPIIQDLPSDGQGVIVSEIHGFPGIEQLQSRGTGTLLINDQISRIIASIEKEMKILAKENGLVCNRDANTPGTSLVLNIQHDHDLTSLHFEGFTSSYKKSFLKVSLQKIPSDKIIPVPSLTLAERIGAKIKGIF